MDWIHLSEKCNQLLALDEDSNENLNFQEMLEIS